MRRYPIDLYRNDSWSLFRQNGENQLKLDESELNDADNICLNNIIFASIRNSSNSTSAEIGDMSNPNDDIFYVTRNDKVLHEVGNSEVLYDGFFDFVVNGNIFEEDLNIIDNTSSEYQYDFYNSKINQDIDNDIDESGGQ